MKAEGLKGFIFGATGAIGSVLFLLFRNWCKFYWLLPIGPRCTV